MMGGMWCGGVGGHGPQAAVGGRPGHIFIYIKDGHEVGGMVLPRTPPPGVKPGRGGGEEAQSLPLEPEGS